MSYIKQDHTNDGNISTLLQIKVIVKPELSNLNITVICVACFI